MLFGYLNQSSINQKLNVSRGYKKRRVKVLILLFPIFFGTWEEIMARVTQNLDPNPDLSKFESKIRLFLNPENPTRKFHNFGLLLKN
ncbi:unnamed protein product [Meloidogyne enterolobii]|uniref:Uncharacterized protein n=1 Tax=Meloidogyne enterolobii TaxID=390850 RepID=A0ACB0Y7U0_MELEN